MEDFTSCNGRMGHRAGKRRRGKWGFGAILLVVGLSLGSGCGLTVRSQMRGVASQLGISDEEVAGVMREAVARHGKDVGWVFAKKTDTSIAIYFGYTSGTVVHYRRVGDRWVEDPGSQTSWSAPEKMPDPPGTQPNY